MFLNPGSSSESLIEHCFFLKKICAGFAAPGLPVAGGLIGGDKDKKDAPGSAAGGDKKGRNIGNEEYHKKQNYL